jgi:L-ascorbate metabolism protein UlaG (beta-lactamase superfamily)
VIIKEKQSVWQGAQRRKNRHFSRCNFGDFLVKFLYMVLTYFGNGCFRLQSGDTSILVNPESNRLKADVTLKTLVAAEDPLAEDGDAANMIAFPGEYEIKGIEVIGFPIVTESTEKFVKTAYAVYWEDMKFVFLGHLSKPMDAAMMEEFSEADVLVLPVGGGHFLEPEVAAKIVKQLEAKIVVPSFYKSPDDFLKALGKKAEKMEKFVFKQKDILADKGRPVVLAQS